MCRFEPEAVLPVGHVEQHLPTEGSGGMALGQRISGQTTSSQTPE